MTKRHWEIGDREFNRSYFKNAFVKSVKKLLAINESKYLLFGGAGI